MLIVAVAQEAQFTTVPKKSSQNQRSRARTEEKMRRARVWYLFKGHPETLARVLRKGRDRSSTSLFLMAQAVIQCTLEGAMLNSSLKRLPKSGMCPPPYNTAILLFPLSIALLSSSVATLFLSPIITESSSIAEVISLNLQKNENYSDGDILVEFLSKYSLRCETPG